MKRNDLAAVLLNALLQGERPAGKLKVPKRKLRKRRRNSASASATIPPKTEAKLRLVKPIRPEVIANAKRGKRPKLDEPSQEQLASFFKAYEPPPGVLPPGVKPMAMDDANTTQIATWAAASFGQYWREGLTWPGYAYLSELTLRPEYRIMSQVVATEMTRKWITFQSVSQDDDDKSEKIKELTDEFDRLHVRDIFASCAEMDGWMGRSHIYIDTGATDDPDELMTSIGDGRDGTTTSKFKKGSLEALKMIEPVWTYPQGYNSTDPLKASWYNPDMWFVMGKRIHASRLLTFIGRPVPDILKPAYAFGGLSLSQISKPYIDNWLQTRQSVNDIIRAFSVMVLQTDLSSVLSASDSDGLAADGSALMTRIDLFNALRDNKGTFVLDKETEDFKNVSAPLSSLDHLQAQSQEHMASVSRIPLIKLLGITPSGLNASSEGELKAFYDTIHAFQEFFFRPNLTRISHFAQMNLWGEIDEEITFKFEDLWAMSERDLAEIRKIDAETDDILMNGCAALAPIDVRKRVATDPDTPHDGLDVDDLPEIDFSGGEEPKGLGTTGKVPFGKGPAGEVKAEDAAPVSLTLVRHGATSLNNEDVSVDRIRGWKDIPLSDEGHKEAERLAGEVDKANPPTVILSSDLKRAHDTAKIIGEAVGVTPIASKAFRPWDVGELAGKTTKEALPVLAEYIDNPGKALPDGESFNDFRNRFFDGLEDALREHAGEKIMIVTHHRGERLLKAWAKAGYPADHAVDIPTFNSKGEHTGSAEKFMIPERDAV